MARNDAYYSVTPAVIIRDGFLGYIPPLGAGCDPNDTTMYMSSFGDFESHFTKDKKLAIPIRNTRASWETYAYRSERLEELSLDKDLDGVVSVKDYVIVPMLEIPPAEFFVLDHTGYMHTRRFHQTVLNTTTDIVKHRSSVLEIRDYDAKRGVIVSHNCIGSDTLFGLLLSGVSMLDMTEKVLANRIGDGTRIQWYKISEIVEYLNKGGDFPKELYPNKITNEDVVRAIQKESEEAKKPRPKKRVRVSPSERRI